MMVSFQRQNGDFTNGNSGIEPAVASSATFLIDWSNSEPASDKLPKPERTGGPTQSIEMISHGRAGLSAPRTLIRRPIDVLLLPERTQRSRPPKSRDQRGSSQISLEDSRTPGAARRYHDLEDDIRSIESSESIL
eukprot:s374_g32.t1